MSVTEGAAILFGLFVGYWIVAKVFYWRSARRKRLGSTPNSVEAPAQPQWYEILQLSPEASMSDIRDAYKHLVSKYHPDKVQDLGVELRDVATRKSQEITAAYRQGLRARGERP